MALMVRMGSLERMGLLDLLDRLETMELTVCQGSQEKMERMELQEWTESLVLLEKTEPLEQSGMGHPVPKGLQDLQGWMELMGKMGLMV
jgi:negative regulator of sigma E activity